MAKQVVKVSIDGELRDAVVLRCETIQTRDNGRQRCAAVRLLCDRTNRAYRFVNVAKLASGTAQVDVDLVEEFN